MRRIALSLPEVVEKPWYGTPGFRVKDKGFLRIRSEAEGGLVVKTLENQDFLTINGVQTLSHSCANLLEDIDALRESGIRSLRLSPQDCDMVEVIRTFRDVIDGREDVSEGNRRLAKLYPNVPCSNGFLHGVAGFSHVAPDQAAAAAPME